MSHPAVTPHVHLHVGPGIAPPRTFKLEDHSTTIYPRLPNGQSCRVVIIRRVLISSHGSAMHVCRNAGKWSYRIDYAFKKGTTRMTRTKFIKEVIRMGGTSHLVELMKGS